MLARRLLSPTVTCGARLVAGSNTTLLTSVSGEYARTPGPAPPPPQPPSRAPSQSPTSSPTSTRRREPIPLPRSSVITNERPLVQPAPPPPPPPRLRDDDDDSRLDALFLQALARTRAAAAAGISVQQAISDSRALAGAVCRTRLAWESTPSAERRVDVSIDPATRNAATQDGIVLVAHVVGGPSAKVVLSSGFAIANSETILTCAHTLLQAEGHLLKCGQQQQDQAPPSATLVLTASGHMYPVSSVLSSVPSSDLLLLELAPTPLDASTSSSSSPCPPLKPLPINPYPCPVATAVATHTYLNPLARLKRNFERGSGGAAAAATSWQRSRVVEYKDRHGHTAEPGTYDELASFWFDAVPTDGSSGGPIVEVESGSVVGVTRGSMHKYGERTRYGFATPAERILDMFALPGFTTTAERERLAADRARVAAASEDGGGKGSQGE
ncbi:hypothetical protein JCM11491_000261 [Sporobolomyces phaffii]